MPLDRQAIRAALRRVGEQYRESPKTTLHSALAGGGIGAFPGATTGAIQGSRDDDAVGGAVRGGLTGAATGALTGALLPGVAAARNGGVSFAEALPLLAGGGALGGVASGRPKQASADPDLNRRTAVCMMADSAGRVMAQEFFKHASVEEMEKEAIVREGISAAKGFLGGALKAPKVKPTGMLGTAGKPGFFEGIGERLRRGLSHGKREYSVARGRSTATPRPTYELEDEMRAQASRPRQPAPKPTPQNTGWEAPTAPSTTRGRTRSAGSPQETKSSLSGRPLTEAEAGIQPPRQGTPRPAPTQGAAPEAPPATPTRKATGEPHARPMEEAMVTPDATAAQPRVSKLVEQEAAKRGLSVRDYLAGVGALGLVGGGGYMLMNHRGQRQPPQPTGYY